MEPVSLLTTRIAGPSLLPCATLETAPGMLPRRRARFCPEWRGDRKPARRAPRRIRLTTFVSPTWPEIQIRVVE
ncbi:MAG: hypothetical protein KGS61_05670 [Verrucomicrobia bacterium]|nr:hypothetical protein [Verrucomicrobiota bacterium]